MRKFLHRNTPPGVELKQELSALGLMLALAALFSLGFYGSYLSARSALFDWVWGKQYLIEGAVIADFQDLIGFWFSGFMMVAFYTVGLLVNHYSQYYRGSRSIYLMKRLPDRLERHRRVWTLPLLALAATAAVTLLLRLICFAVYLLATPTACLPPQVWQQLWRIF